MKPVICPTVTTDNAEEYKVRVGRLAAFAPRIHIDLADGEFTPVALLPVNQVWWPGELAVDVHLMYQKPMENLDFLLGKHPQLIVVHAEADVDVREFARRAHKAGVKAGLALLADTPVNLAEAHLKEIDHVLIFSGSLGRHGGQADLTLLGKVQELKSLKPELEIGWDGGVNDQVAASLAAGGVDVLNTGGFIQHAPDPKAAYETLERQINPLPSTPNSL